MSFTLWFMGRPASGKSTLAKRVEAELRQRGKQVENLDGDELRENLHPDLGFTREDRALNNRRTAFICRLLNRNGISVVNAMITPFRDAQREARDIVEPDGDFVLVYVKCSLEECARRDPKGLYEQANRGDLENFTGINHPFQEPHNPDIVVNTERQLVEECVDSVVEYLMEDGILSGDATMDYRFDIDGEEEAEILERLVDLGYLRER